MARRIRDQTLQAAGAPVAGGQADGYFDKVVKYVPADVIAAWTAAVAVIKGAPAIPTWVLLICLVVGLATSYWWTLKQTEVPNQPPASKQAIVATIAFLVWVLALGDLDMALKSAIAWWDQAYAKLLLIAFTLVSGKV
jgi:hypothetical protein